MKDKRETKQIGLDKFEKFSKVSFSNYTSDKSALYIWGQCLKGGKLPPETWIETFARYDQVNDLKQNKNINPSNSNTRPAKSAGGK